MRPSLLLASALACSLPFVRQSVAQAPLGAADSALVGRILLAEDRRDASDSALGEGVRHQDARIQLLARRAISRIGDPKFASRDSFPALPAPPLYADPAWRLRYRALKPTDCVALRGALADSVWAVRLHAMDLAGPDCAKDSLWVRTLLPSVRSPPPNGPPRPGGVSWPPAAPGLPPLGRI